MRQCFICGKKSQMVGNLKKLRGKYNPTSKKRKQPNLQWVDLPSGTKIRQEGKITITSSFKRVKACTKCIKALSKNK
jgi:ribosomal protein L28